MLTAYSEQLPDLLATLKPHEREALADELEQRSRDADRYELLVLFLGYSGLHRLYLKDIDTTLRRLSLTLTVGVFLVLGIVLASMPLLLLALLGSLLMLGFWVGDYLHLGRDLAHFHAELEWQVRSALARKALTGYERGSR